MQDARATLTVLDALAGMCDADGSAALATVVRTAGSTYRKAGARMAVSRGGRTVGAISAGCLEEDVIAAAADVCRRGSARLLRYDNGAREDVIWGLGLGCNGQVDILVEPVARGDRTAVFYGHVAGTLRSAPRCVLATVFEAAPGSGARPGSHLLVLPDGTASGDLDDLELRRAVGHDSLTLMEHPRSLAKAYSLRGAAAVEVSLEPIVPPCRLVVVGADPDAAPLVRLAAAAGFRVTVVDHRGTHARPDRFPEAEEIVVCRPREIADRVRLDEQTFVVVKTHSFIADQETLHAVLPSAVRYVGQMGPSSRAADLLAALRAQGLEPTEPQLARFYGPLGLDVAAETAEEIAVSVVAELLALRGGRDGGFLKTKGHRIHPEDLTAAAGSPAANG